MSEGRILILGAIPLLAGALWLAGLRRADAVATPVAGPIAPAAQAQGAALDARAEGHLGVIVAGYSADVGAEVSGSVTEVLASVGGRVKQGEPLLRVDPGAASDDLRASRARLEQQQSEVASAEAELAEAADLVRRLESIAGGVSDRQLVAARTREQQARASVAQAKAGTAVQRAAVEHQVTRSGKHTIRAPFDGLVVERFVDPGALVLPGQIVVRVITDDYYVRFAVPADTARAHGVGDRVRVELSDGSDPLRGAVSDVQPEIDAAAQLVVVRARIEVADDDPRRSVLSGVRVRVRFEDARGGG